MKVLQLCHKAPFPASDGGTKAMQAIAQGLIDNGCKVDVLSIATHKHPHPEPGSSKLAEKTNAQFIEVDTKVKWMGALKGLFQKDSYHTSRFVDEKFDSVLTETLEKKSYDVVIFESLFTAPYLATVRAHSKAKCVYREHNIESQLWEARSQGENALNKKVLQNFNNKLKRFEFSIVNNFDAIACISERDLNILKENGLEVPADVIPFGISMIAEPTKQSNKKRIGFLGSLDWEPNVEGLNWFIEKVWDKVHESHPSWSFHIGGRNASERFKESLPPTITFEGEINDADGFIESCNIVIVPLFTGSGIRIKLIEAVSKGIPVVTTTTGARGLPGDYQNAVLIADNKTEFFQALSTLCSNSKKREEIGQNGFQYCKEHFEMKQVAKSFISFVNGMKVESE
jgi:glycosyltransferase involved in cell wall biosynthesis